MALKMKNRHHYRHQRQHKRGAPAHALRAAAALIIV